MKPETANNKLYDYFLDERVKRRWPLPDADIAKQFEGISKSDIYNYRRAMHIPGVDIRRENIWRDAEIKRQNLTLELVDTLKARRQDLLFNIISSLIFLVLLALALVF